MQGIVGLIHGMAEASRSVSSLRSLAEAAAQALVGLFPQSSVVIYESDPCESIARVVGGANLPPDWLTHVVCVDEIPLLRETLQSPTLIVERTVERGVCGIPLDATFAGALQALCTSVAAAGGPQYALIFTGPAGTEDDPCRRAAIEVTRRLLAASTELGTGRALMRTAIHRAKLEWEHTVDALPEMVGLLDSQLRVVRISRALERWQLGVVRDAVGRDLHSLLHPSCRNSSCALSASIKAAADELPGAAYSSFELADPVLSLDVTVELRIVPDRERAIVRNSTARVAFVVANVTSLRNAERALKSLNQALEQRVEERTGELRATNRALREEVEWRRGIEKSLQRSKRELETLSEQLMNAQEAERKRISQDMHDSVGQMLSAIKYSLERAQVLTRRRAPDEAAGAVELAIRRVQRLMDEVRNISMNLRPALLDDLGAASAVRSLCRDWQEVYRGIEVQIDISVLDEEIPRLLVTNVFRAVQESLNNVARHAAALHVCVSMHVVAGVLLVAVRDDGAGFLIDGDGGATAGTRGLRSLRERAERTGGRCEVSSAPGRGTTVQLEWPLAAGQAAQLANTRVN